MTPREIVNRKLRKWIVLWFVGFGVLAATPVIAIAFHLLSDNDPRFVLHAARSGDDHGAIFLHHFCRCKVSSLRCQLSTASSFLA